MYHLFGLKLVRFLPPNTDKHPQMGLVFTFWAIALLHLTEIAFGALVLWLLQGIPGTGELGLTFGSRVIDYLYLAGTCFATLGYAQIEAVGPIRLFIMFLALSGFMVITWSATFIFEIWGKTYGNEDKGDQADEYDKKAE